MENTEFKFLPSEAKTYFRVHSIIWICVFTVMALIASITIMVVSWAFAPWWLWVSALLLLAFSIWLFIFFLPERKFNAISWQFDELGMHYNFGIWWNISLSVPRSRVQHIDVVQGPILRHFGLANLVLHTAGTINASITMSALNFEVAKEIRNDLLHQDSQDVI